MNKSSDVLSNFIKSKSQFFDLPDGAEAEVQFLFAEAVTTHYQGKEVECIRYHFMVDGKEMCWDRTSREFAKQMAEISEDSFIYIKRMGQKNKTKYIVNKLDKC